MHGNEEARVDEHIPIRVWGETIMLPYVDLKSAGLSTLLGVERMARW